jgi:hypothetical protein
MQVPGAAATRATSRLIVVVWLSISALLPRVQASSFVQRLMAPCFRDSAGSGRREGGTAAATAERVVQGGGESSLPSSGKNDEMLERVTAARKAVLRKGWKAAVGGGGERV